MKIDTVVSHDVPAKELAASLANSTPEEFAAFWFAFSQEIDGLDDGDAVMLNFAKEMSSLSGNKRKEPLRALCKMMDHFEVAAKYRGAL